MNGLVIAAYVRARSLWGRMPYPGLLAAVAALLVALLLLAGWPEAAEARVGGGQNFSRGGGGFSGGSGRSGGSGGGGDLLFLLVWLVVEHPAVGIPVLVVVVVVFVVRSVMARSGTRSVSRTHNHDDGSWLHTPRTPVGIPGLAELRKADVGFSMPVLLDYLQLLHRRSTEAAVTQEWAALEPFVSHLGRSDLTAAHQGVSEVRDVVTGGIQVVRVDQDSRVFRLHVAIQSTRREALTSGGSRHVYVEEGWTIVRDRGVTSKAPEEVVRMGCPNCGSAIETDRFGNCRVCQSPILGDPLQWRAVAAAVQTRRHVQPPKVGWTSGGTEPSVHVPTVMDPNVAVGWRNFRGRHPDFDPQAFQARVEGIYFNLQQSWSDGRWEAARPFVTDTLYQTPTIPSGAVHRTWAAQCPHRRAPRPQRRGQGRDRRLV